jgi:membrane protein CcdC involved in cytochrome C biogenesis
VEGAVSPSRRQVVSKRAIYAAAILIGLHILAYAYVVDQRISYDQGDLEGLLWWIVAFLVLPAAALLTLAVSLVAQWLKSKNPSGE